MSELAPLKLPLALLLLVPIAPALSLFAGATPVLVFVAGAVGIAVLADWVRRGTEHVSAHAGQAVGGLLSVSLGSLAELILAIFVLASGKFDVVRAQITGSILGTSLLGLGIAIVVGTIGRESLRFKRERASLLSSLLILVVIALLLPAVFDHTIRAAHGPAAADASDERLSLGAAGILLLLYIGNMAYTLVTHRDVFASSEPEGEDQPPWPLWTALLVLAAATAAIALEAELVSNSLEAASASLHLPESFVGVVILALIGTASDLVAGASFARDGKMGLVLSVCIGSAIQVALVLAPLLVLISWAIGHPMTLVFPNPLDLFAIAGAAFIISSIAGDGEVTWFEGVLLVGVYALFALGFFFAS